MVYAHTFRTEHTETKTTSSSYGDFYEKQKIVHVHIEPQVVQMIQQVDDRKEEFIEELKKIVAIPSISCDYKRTQELNSMMDYVEDWMKRLEIKYERYNIGWHEIEGATFKLPNVIIGQTDASAKKKTICVYANVDITGVEDVSDEGDSWKTDPFVLTEINKRLYGKGVARGKGPLLCWFHALDCYKRCEVDLPINIMFIIEGMRESKSYGLEHFLNAKKNTILIPVDDVVICESEWLGDKYPCLVYGTVGTNSTVLLVHS